VTFSRIFSHSAAVKGTESLPSDIAHLVGAQRKSGGAISSEASKIARTSYCPCSPYWHPRLRGRLLNCVHSFEIVFDIANTLIGKIIERHIGGHGFHSLEMGPKHRWCAARPVTATAVILARLPGRANNPAHAIEFHELSPGAQRIMSSYCHQISFSFRTADKAHYPFWAPALDRRAVT
jgi:hypothetical protein